MHEEYVLMCEECGHSWVIPTIRTKKHKSVCVNCRLNALEKHLERQEKKDYPLLQVAEPKDNDIKKQIKEST